MKALKVVGIAVGAVAVLGLVAGDFLTTLNVVTHLIIFKSKQNKNSISAFRREISRRNKIGGARRV